MERHVYPRTVVSVSYHYKNPTKRVDLAQSGPHHHLIKLTCYRKIFRDLSLSMTMTRRWFSPGIAVFITNKTDRHDIAEILLKMALNTITYFFKQNRMLINMYGHSQ